MPNKTWIITGAVVVAAAIGYVALRGPQVPRKGTEGAIGAAKRYESQQISNQDVTLDSPQVASFIQSDAFRKLATDKSFREAAKHQELASFITSNDLRAASAKIDAGKVLESAAVQELLRSEAFRTSVESGMLTEALRKAPELFASTEAARFEALLSTPRLDALVRKTEFQRLAQEYVRRTEAAKTDAAKTAEQLQKTEAVKMDAVKTLAEFNQLAEQYGLRNSDELRRFEASRYFTDALAKGLMSLFSSPELANYTVEGLRKTLEDKSFIEASKTEGFIMFMEALKTPADLAVAKDISSSADMLSILSNNVYREAAMHAEFSQVAKAGLEAAVLRFPTE